MKLHRYTEYNPTKLKHRTTLELVASEGPRFLSVARVSNSLSKWTPSLLDKILTPLSLVVTANNDPSLLNLSLELACKEKNGINSDFTLELKF